jgi:hypothetical protein
LPFDELALNDDEIVRYQKVALMKIKIIVVIRAVVA